MDNPPFKLFDWVCRLDDGVACQVIGSESVWGEVICRVWLPETDTVIKIAAKELVLLIDASSISVEKIVYIATAGRIASCISEGTLLSPIESSVFPLPHQLKALKKALSSHSVRYLLADEVGLGKTIEAGLIMRELKLRNQVNRILIVTPKGLVSQWIAEMDTHFNETFVFLNPSEFSNKDESNWQRFDQVLCSMDSIKPIEKRKGWSVDKIAEYNQLRFDSVISAGWDLVIVDESHRLGGSTDQVARYKLGQGLADAAPYLLLLSATPHQGKTDGFHRLISLLDNETFPDEQSVTPERVKPFVIRTEKKQAIDIEGQALFKPRQTQLISVEWQSKHALQRQLYDAVTDYVREGYNQALEQKQNAIGFLMILMQRLVTSSPNAIKATLERRLEVLNQPRLATNTSLLSEEEWCELEGQQQADILLNSRVKALSSEKQEVEWLLSLAQQCVDQGIDAKADALLDWVNSLQREENDPYLKVLIFTEFIPTQQMLISYLEGRGISVTALNGSLSLKERKQVQEEFAQDARVLVSTDAGGEGLNLQFCHVIINYDIPWNPMRLEQRIGRVDRIGQKFIVRALNFVFADTAEYRVREVLEEKLNIILEEYGVDKTSDVLDSLQASQIFDGLYTGAIQNPDLIDEEIEKALAELKQQAKSNQSHQQIYIDQEPLDPSQCEKISEHPLPAWVERMTLNYLSAQGEKAYSKSVVKDIWSIGWPDGEVWDRLVFSNQAALDFPTAVHVTLEKNKIRELFTNIPYWIKGQPVPVMSIPGLPSNVNGLWSLWQISVSTNSGKEAAYLAVFYSDQGKCFSTTANRIWELLLSNTPVLLNYNSETAQDDFSVSKRNAEELGVSLFEELKLKHTKKVKSNEQKGEYAFLSRRRAIGRVGLPQVREFRLKQLDQEYSDWLKTIAEDRKAIPALDALLIIRVAS